MLSPGPSAGDTGHVLKCNYNLNVWVHSAQRDRFHPSVAAAVALALSCSQVSPEIIGLFLMRAEILAESKQRVFKIK